MTARKNMTSALMMLLIAGGITISGSCKKDMPQRGGINKELLVAGRLDGTWTTPVNIVTPDNVPAAVFGAMRVVFTTDAAGNPSKFMAQDCPIVFGNGNAGTWNVSGTQDSARIKVTGPGPVDEFNVKVTSTSLTLSFYMGWENTETKETGKGNFQVTLTRQ